MNVELSEEQRQALDAQPGQPLRVVDPRTQKAYVLIPAEVYDRIEAPLDEDDLRGTYPAQMESALRAGWDDPAMDDYNNYDENLKKLWP
jgi:hypothetical protein